MYAFKIQEEIKIIDLFLKHDRRLTQRYKDKLEIRKKKLKSVISYVALGGAPVLTASEDQLRALKQETLGQN